MRTYPVKVVDGTVLIDTDTDIGTSTGVGRGQVRTVFPESRSGR